MLHCSDTNLRVWSLSARIPCDILRYIAINCWSVCLFFLYDYCTLARMKTDIQIARETPLKPIQEIAAGLQIDSSSVIPYGFYTAKIPYTHPCYVPDADKSGYREDNGFHWLGARLAENWKKCGVGIARAFAWSLFWHEGGSGRRRLCAGSPYGRYQFAFYWRLSRDYFRPQYDKRTAR